MKIPALITGGIIFALMTTIYAEESVDPLMLVAGTAAYRPPAATVETLPKIEMGKGGDKILYAAIFRPKSPPSDPMPAILFIHGGGWRSGSHYNTFAAWLAERGYLVASIDYRLTKEAVWPAQIEDCKLGVRWLRANAATYHIDPDRIGVWGTSAGGHLAACVGVMDDPVLEGTGGYAGVSSRVKVVADFCGPTDFTGNWDGNHPYPDWVIALCGVSREEKPELWKQASPILSVKAGEPPFLVAHGEDDHHVPFPQGENFAKALEKAGNSVEWLPIKNGGHDFFLNTTTPQSTIEPNHEVIMARLLAFFDKHLKKSP